MTCGCLTEFTWKRIVGKSLGAPSVSYELWLDGELVGGVRGLIGGGWTAYANINDQEIWYQTGSPVSARNALEREIDRRSIGLLGVDEIGWAFEA